MAFMICQCALDTYDKVSACPEKIHICTIELGNIISYKTACAPTEDSDQPAHHGSLSRIFIGHSVVN